MAGQMQRDTSLRHAASKEWRWANFEQRLSQAQTPSHRFHAGSVLFQAVLARATPELAVESAEQMLNVLLAEIRRVEREGCE